MEINKSYTLKSCSITKEKVKQILSDLKPSSVTTGITSMSITEHGGVHSSGKQTWAPSVSLEFPVSRSYVVILLYGYPKGIIMHLFLPLSKQLSDFNQTTLVKLLENLVRILQDNVVSDDRGFVKHDDFKPY